jgi:metallo-beta-lactamase family protein
MNRATGVDTAFKKQAWLVLFAITMQAVILLSAPPLLRAETKPPYIRFLGAAQTVGGSSYLVDTGQLRILVDCGHTFEKAQNGKNEHPPFDPARLDYVLLTHAHADHAGSVPLLFKRGFRGRVIGTDATRALAGNMLEQGLEIAEEKGKALFGMEDIIQMMSHFDTARYNQTLSLSPEASVCFRDAGHILGSAMIELVIRDKNGPIKLVFGGDMGNPAIPWMREPAVIRSGDYILVESTYGPVRRSDREEWRKFGAALGRTIHAGGSVLIPAFTLDRTQKIIHSLGLLKKEGMIPLETPVYVDSPGARTITKIYRKYKRRLHPDVLNAYTKGQAFLTFPGLRETEGKESLLAHGEARPAVYVSASGMLDHANSPRHLEKMIDDPRNLLAIVGWQAPETLGAKMQRGAKRVAIPLIEIDEEGNRKVRYVEKSVRMQVKSFGAFSYHADGCQILTWLSHFPKVKEIFVVHGEPENAAALARFIQENLGFAASAPGLHETVPLTSRGQGHAIKDKPAPCRGLGGTKVLKSGTEE